MRERRPLPTLSQFQATPHPDAPSLRRPLVMEVPQAQLLEGLAFAQHVEAGGEDGASSARSGAPGAEVNHMAAAAGHLVEAFKEVAALTALLGVADVPRVPQGSAAFRVRFGASQHCPPAPRPAPGCPAGHGR